MVTRSPLVADVLTDEPTNDEEKAWAEAMRVTRKATVDFMVKWVCSVS